MPTLKKYLFIFLLLEMFFSYATVYAQATTDYTKAGVSDQIKQYLCAPSDVNTQATGYTSGNYLGTNSTPAFGNNNSNDLFNCINQLYKFSIVVASVIGVFFIVIAGYLYIASEGNSESVEKAKNILVSTITSLVILMGGYVLLKALNPDLVQLRSIQPPSVTLQPVGSVTGIGGGTGGGGAQGSCSPTFGGTAATGCSGSSCVDVSSYTPSHDCTSNGGICLLSPQAAQKAQNLINKFNQSGTGCTLKISAAIEGSSGPSVSSCHKNGTCADFNVIQYNATCAQAFYSAAQSAGATSLLDEYVPACVAGSTTGGNIHVNF